MLQFDVAWHKWCDIIPWAAIFSEPVSYSKTEASGVVCLRRRRQRRPSVNNLTMNYVDTGFLKTMQQNLMRLGTGIVYKVLMMHVI